MPKILSIDTASTSVSVALITDNALQECSNEEANKHTECIIGLIDQILNENHCTLSDLDAIAFGAGPGAFTGLRVACGIAQGLSWARNLPVVCVSNLEAAAIRTGVNGRFLVAMDARMHECYVGVYDITDNAVRELLAPQLAKPDEVAQLIRDHAVTHLAGSGFRAYSDEITIDGQATLVHTDVATACDIARRAVSLFHEGKTTTSALAAPLYVRNRVALTIDQRAAGQRL